jgi:hypothetical protein
LLLHLLKEQVYLNAHIGIRQHKHWLPTASPEDLNKVGNPGRSDPWEQIARSAPTGVKQFQIAAPREY